MTAVGRLAVPSVCDAAARAPESLTISRYFANSSGQPSIGPMYLNPSCSTCIRRAAPEHFFGLEQDPFDSIADDRDFVQIQRRRAQLAVQPAGPP